MKASEVKIGDTYLANVSGKRTKVHIDAESQYGGWDATNVTTGKKVRIKTAGRLHGATGKKDGQPKAKKADQAKADKYVVRETDGTLIWAGVDMNTAIEQAQQHVEATGRDTEVARGKSINGEFHAEFTEVFKAAPEAKPDEAAKPDEVRPTDETTKPAEVATPATEIAKPDVIATPDVAAKPAKKARKERMAKKTSALDAAARVLAEAGQPMSCQEMIEAMAAKGYWSSPKGKTPSATLYAAILREISAKGEQARFTKTQRGMFQRRATAE